MERHRLQHIYDSVCILIKELECIDTMLREQIVQQCSELSTLRPTLNSLWVAVDELDELKKIRKAFQAEINQKKLGG